MNGLQRCKPFFYLYRAHHLDTTASIACDLEQAECFGTLVEMIPSYCNKISCEVA